MSSARIMFIPDYPNNLGLSQLMAFEALYETSKRQLFCGPYLIKRERFYQVL